MQRRQAVSHLTGQAARLYARALDRRLGRLGVSSGQAPVLIALAEGVALSQKALTDSAGVAQPTMAATLSRMERDGLITRRPDPGDHRSMLFALTSEGRQDAPLFIEAINEVNEASLLYLNERERTALVRLLGAVVDGLGSSLSATE